jgi:hypothetical protein
MNVIPQRPQRPLTIGDAVAHSVQWLQSVGMSHSDLSHARGTVVAIKVNGGQVPNVITVDWGIDDDIPPRILESNLALVGPNMRFCNCG